MLRGRWSGWTTFTNYEDTPVITTLLLTNATVPLHGSITLDFGNAPRVARVFPADAKTGGNLATIQFQNGMISDRGTFIGTTGQNSLELTLRSGEKMKMNGFFYYYGTRGTVDFTK